MQQLAVATRETGEPAVQNDVTGVLHRLHAELGESRFAAMLPAFVSYLETQLRRIDRAITRGDYDSLRHYCSLLRISTERMGFSGFSQLVGRIEQQADGARAPEAALCHELSANAEHMLMLLIGRLPA